MLVLWLFQCQRESRRGSANLQLVSIAIDGLQKNWMKSTTYSPLHKTKEDSGPGECGKMYAEVQEKWRSNLEVEKRQYQEKGILDHLSEV